MPKTNPRILQLQLLFRRKNRARLVRYLKAHPCVDCGEVDIRVLDFDHKVPSLKSHNVTRMAISNHFSWQKVEQEIAKCEVRCSNCHRKKTIGKPDWFLDIDAFEETTDSTIESSRLRPGFIHGTATGYRYYGCRCSLCRSASTMAARKYRLAVAEKKMHGTPKPASQDIVGANPTSETIS